MFLEQLLQPEPFGFGPTCCGTVGGGDVKNDEVRSIAIGRFKLFPGLYAEETNRAPSCMYFHQHWAGRGGVTAWNGANFRGSIEEKRKPESPDDHEEQQRTDPG